MLEMPHLYVQAGKEEEFKQLVTKSFNSKNSSRLKRFADRSIRGPAEKLAKIGTQDSNLLKPPGG